MKNIRVEVQTKTQITEFEFDNWDDTTKFCEVAKLGKNVKTVSSYKEEKPLITSIKKMPKKITTKEDAFKVGYLVSSGINIEGEYYSSVYKSPPNLSVSATFAYAGGGKTEDEALLDALNWIEKKQSQN